MRVEFVKIFAVIAMLLAIPGMSVHAAAAVANAESTVSVADQGDGDYHLGSADKVRIIVFNEPTLSGDFAVSGGGILSFPLIGDIVAKGRTTSELSREIERKLGDGYLRSPQVSMDVLSYRPFYILGEVTKPGEYPYSTGLTVMNAVARAEGYTYRANKRRVFIKRAGSTLEEQVQITPNLQVRPGDTIRIGERYF